MKILGNTIATVFMLVGVLYLGIGVYVSFEQNFGSLREMPYSYSVSALMLGLLLTNIGVLVFVKRRIPKIIIGIIALSYLINFIIGYSKGEKLILSLLSEQDIRFHGQYVPSELVAEKSVKLDDLYMFHNAKLNPDKYSDYGVFLLKTNVSVLDSILLATTLQVGMKPIPPEYLTIEYSSEGTMREIHIRNYKWAYGAFVYSFSRNQLNKIIEEVIQNQ